MKLTKKVTSRVLNVATVVGKSRVPDNHSGIDNWPTVRYGCHSRVDSHFARATISRSSVTRKVSS
jgi:hypothetical protein